MLACNKQRKERKRKKHNDNESISWSLRLKACRDLANTTSDSNELQKKYLLMSCEQYGLTSLTP